MTDINNLPNVDDDPFAIPDFLDRRKGGKAAAPVAQAALPVEDAVTLRPGAPDSHPTLGRPSGSWTYTDGTGAPVAKTYRFDFPDGRKEYRPFNLQTGEWRAPQVRPLYRLHEILARPDAPVVVVEGEKTADALQSVLPDYVVTTSMNGAQSAAKADWSPLRDRQVIIWPDADEPGSIYARIVGSLLEDLTESVLVIPMKNADDLKDLASNAGLGTDNFSPGKGWDAADAVDEGWDASWLSRLLYLAVPYDTYTQSNPYTENPKDTEDAYTHSPRLENNGEVLPRVDVDAPRADPSLDTCDIDPEAPTAPPIVTSLTATDDDWPDPDMSILSLAPPRPRFPHEVFGPFWGQWIRDAAEGVSGPQDYVACALLTGSSALIGNARWVSPWEGWKEPPILWSAVVGSPSAHKSPSMDPVLNLVAKLEAEALPEHETALRQHAAHVYEAKIKNDLWEKEAKEAVLLGHAPPVKPEDAVPPAPPQRIRHLVSDATIEALVKLLAAHPRGVLHFRDELAGWFGNFDRYGGNGGDRAFWIEAYGGRSYVPERVKNDGVPTQVRHLSVSVLGGIQPDRAAALFHKGDDDGLTSRFLYVWPDKVEAERPNVVANQERALSGLRCLSDLQLGTSGDSEAEPVIMLLSDEAAALFQDWRKPHVANEPASGRFAGWWGKCPGFVLRIAANLQLLWWSAESDPTPPETIGMLAVDAAIKLVDDYFTPMARIVYTGNAPSREYALASALAEEIQARGNEILNGREVYKFWNVPGIRNAETFQDAATVLTTANWLRHARYSGSAKGGRSRNEFIVHPKLIQN